MAQWTQCGVPGPSSDSGTWGAVGLADLLDEAPAQQIEVAQQGVDRVNGRAGCPPSGCLVLCCVPVCPLGQGHAEDAGTVAQAGHGVAHGASLSERLDSVSRDAPTVVSEHARKVDKSFGHARRLRSGLRVPLSSVRWRHVDGQLTRVWCGVTVCTCGTHDEEPHGKTTGAIMPGHRLYPARAY